MVVTMVMMTMMAIIMMVVVVMSVLRACSPTCTSFQSSRIGSLQMPPMLRNLERLMAMAWAPRG